jgi:hypothetical protein
MRHVRDRLSPSAAQGLEDLLRTAPEADDNAMPEGLRGTKEGERLAEYLNGLDRHSISDRAESMDAIGHAVELMRERGQLDTGSGPRMRDLRRRGEGERVAGSDEPPAFAGMPRPGNSPLPGRQERRGIDRRKRMAGDSTVKVGGFFEMFPEARRIRTV